MRAKEFWSGLLFGLVLGWAVANLCLDYAYRDHRAQDQKLLIAVSRGSEELQKCTGNLFAAERRVHVRK